MTGLAKIIIGMCTAVVAAAGALVGCAQSQPSAGLPNATCGRVITRLLTSDTQLLSASPGALSCFDTAASSCRAASIQVTEMGVDTGAQYVFVVRPSAPPCQVTEYNQYYSANFGGSESQVTSASCGEVALAGSGVMLRCAGQDYLIPAAVSNGQARS